MTGDRTRKTGTARKNEFRHGDELIRRQPNRFRVAKFPHLRFNHRLDNLDDRTTQILFAIVRADTETPETTPTLGEIADRADRLLQRRYGHERPIDLYDHPAAIVLQSGRNAARRLADPDDIERDEERRVEKWQSALSARALTMRHPGDGNTLMSLLKRHGQYEVRTVMMGE